MVPLELKEKWSAKLGGKLTSPVIANSIVLVASVDTHTVYALKESTGTKLWSFTAGSRVDSTPTMTGGLVLFGSSDGWAYCLRATDGAVVWRFHAAPEDRSIMAFEQLESAWPIHGSVLVQMA